MVAISERVAKTQHVVWGNAIIAYSLKVGSTTIYAHTYGANRVDRARAHKIGQHEAIASGKDIHLWVRHPLDRLVSCYVFFTKKANNSMKYILEASAEDHSILMGQNTQSHLNKGCTIEEWYEASQRHYNSHWEPQWDYHTTDAGVLVPNKLYPMESLKTLRCEVMNASPRTGTWEDYYTDAFREKMEERYANDIMLYERAKEEWDGSALTVLQGSK